MHATHAVVDERDGCTLVRDGTGALLDAAAARALAGTWNEACKPGQRTYAVYTLVRHTSAPDRPGGLAAAPAAVAGQPEAEGKDRG